MTERLHISIRSKLYKELKEGHNPEELTFSEYVEQIIQRGITATPQTKDKHITLSFGDVVNSIMGGGKHDRNKKEGISEKKKAA